MERRRHPRIPLKAFGFNHVCVVRDLPYPVTRAQAASFEVMLIDISPGGARLWRQDGDLSALDSGARINLEPRFKFEPDFPDIIPSTVRWIRDNEFGLQFRNELAYGATDLQALLDR